MRRVNMGCLKPSSELIAEVCFGRGSLKYTGTFRMALKRPCIAEWLLATCGCETEGP